MATNFPGPYQVRIKYVVDSREHIQRLNVVVDGTPDPGTPMADIDFLEVGGGMIDGDTAIASWVTLMKPFLTDDDGEFINAELWKFEDASNDASFVSVTALGVAGTGTGTTIPASQLIWTARTANGGTLRIELLDGQIAPGVPDFAPFTLATNQAIDAALVGSDNWIYGRDNSYPVAMNGFFPGQSEYWFKQIFGR